MTLYAEWIVLPQDTRSGVILADPLSRWELLSEHRIFDKKCRDWGVDPERIEVTTWNWRRTYETWMRIQTNYSFFLGRHHTIELGSSPIFSFLPNPGVKDARIRVWYR